jgi:hypothetical protein
MVNTVRPEIDNKQQPEAISVLRKHASQELLEKVLGDITTHRGMSLNDESLRVSGTYAHALQVTQLLDHIASSLPRLLETTWSDTRAKEVVHHDKIVDTLNDTTNRLIQQATLNTNAPRDFKTIVITASLTLLGSTIFSQFVLFPAELRQARVGDGEVMEWLATADGKLLKAAFKSGNKSVEDCVKRAGSRNRGQKSTIFCEIQIQK